MLLCSNSMLDPTSLNLGWAIVSLLICRTVTHNKWESFARWMFRKYFHRICGNIFIFKFIYFFYEKKTPTQREKERLRERDTATPTVFLPLSTPASVGLDHRLHSLACTGTPQDVNSGPSHVGSIVLLLHHLVPLDNVFWWTEALNEV